MAFEEYLVKYFHEEILKNKAMAAIIRKHLRKK